MGITYMYMYVYLYLYVVSNRSGNCLLVNDNFVWISWYTLNGGHNMDRQRTSGPKQTDEEK